MDARLLWSFSSLLALLVLAGCGSGENTAGSAPAVVNPKVTRGFEVVDALAELPMTCSTDGAMSQPVTPIIIRKVTARP